jgi:UDP-hydrolysing UDP-N-acetyl-D-glucosamine 2-epimerase
VESETLLTQTLSTGYLTSQLAPYFDEDKLDCLVVVADRFEILAGAIAATYQNIPLVHIQGGEISGNIDDKVRNGVSSLSDLHFPCTKKAFSRLLSNPFVRGEVYFYGCPAMDLVFRRNPGNIDEILKNTSHTGPDKNPGECYNLVIYHPETDNFENADALASTFFEKIFEASKFKHYVVLWPNIDAGSDVLAKAIRRLREKNNNANISFYKNFSAENFIDVLSNANILIGNSSSFIREGEVLNKKALIIGQRQNGRDFGPNVKLLASLSEVSIETLNSKPEEENLISNDYGKGDSGSLIASEILNHFFPLLAQ